MGVVVPLAMLFSVVCCSLQIFGFWMDLGSGGFSGTLTKNAPIIRNFVRYAGSLYSIKL